MTGVDQLHTLVFATILLVIFFKPHERLPGSNNHDDQDKYFRFVFKTLYVVFALF